MARTWTHSAASRAELTADIVAGLGRAISHDWQSGTPVAPVNDFRAYLAYSAATAATLAGLTVRLPDSSEDLSGGRWRVNPNPRASANQERVDLARALMRTWALLGARARLDGLPGPGVQELTTQHDSYDTGIAPLVVAAIAVASVGISASLSYVAFQAAQVVDRYLARSEDTQRLVETDARLVELAALHADREKAAGKTLPIDEPTRQAVSSLTAAQKQILQREPELKSGLERLGGGFGGFSGGLSLGLVAAVVVAVVLLKSEAST